MLRSINTYLYAEISEVFLFRACSSCGNEDGDQIEKSCFHFNCIIIWYLSELFDILSTIVIVDCWFCVSSSKDEEGESAQT